MRSNFSPEALSDPAMAASEAIIRKCVHCGFCTATCPTYVLLGDELDSPRGRIYMIKDMLEREVEPSAEVVKHVDRCLSCLSCMTTCPSGVNYMHLVDHARAYIEQRYRRPLHERLIRAMLAFVLPHPRRFRAALMLAKAGRPFARVIGKVAWARPMAAMLALAPDRVPPKPVLVDRHAGGARGRVILLQGCAEQVLQPQYRDAAARILNRAGYDVLAAPGEGCCGALVHHMGRERDSLDAARRNIDSWSRCIVDREVDAILFTTSGCGTTIKDYGFMLRDDMDYAGKAARVSALARDISEFLATIELPAGRTSALKVAYHAACSLQHGQKVTEAPKRLLAAAGYTISTPLEAHICCGSAGTYNILQPEIAGRLGERKVDNLERLKPDVIATGNIGCAIQIGGRSAIPVVHTVELLDWATGGPRPAALSRFSLDQGAPSDPPHA